MSLIKASAIKKQIRDAGMRVSKDVVDQVNRKVVALLEKAIINCTADKRKTVLPQDIV